VKKTRPLRIPIESLKQGSNRLELEFDIVELGGDRHEVAENPSFEQLEGLVKVELDIVRTGRRFLVNGAVRFRARMMCAVCTREYERDFVEPLQTEFLGEGEVPPPDGKVLDGHDVEYVKFSDDTFDVGPMVRDAIHLAIPIAPACRPDCKGLCVTCGRELNDGPCDCPPPADTPFAGLDELVGEPPPEGP